MQDPFGRRVRYLRLSLTSACAMRCTYCRPHGWKHLNRNLELTAAEISQLVGHLVHHQGVRKVRLTGGEPTHRADIVAIVQSIASMGGLADLAMTTNALTLYRLAAPLAQAGLRRINVSLDSVDPRRFEQITGVDGLHRVIAGLHAARRAGLSPIKLNTVVVRGQNDHELADLVAFAADHRCAIRFIELMPMGPLAAHWKQRYVAQAEMRDRLADIVNTWVEQPRDSGSARNFNVTLNDRRTAEVGFISAMSCPFCDRCDRIRIGCTGELYPCLLDKPAGSLLPALRPTFDPDQLDRLLAASLIHKPAEHPATGTGVMTAIGG